MHVKKIVVASVSILALCGAAFALYLTAKSPSHARNWKMEYKVLPAIEFDGSRMTVRNIRNFAYSPDREIQEIRYYDRTFDLNALESAWYGISHFAGLGLAHTFLSFGFQNGEFVTVSVEARLEVAESYHPVTGLFRNYELAYVIGDERDIIGLRTHIRKEKVYLYRLEIDTATAGRVFREMLETADRVYRTPRFYNTLFDNCTTNLIDLAKNLSFFEKYFDYRILLPGFSDELAYEKEVVRTDVPLEQLRESSLLDSKACQIEDPDFSEKMRSGR